MMKLTQETRIASAVALFLVGLCALPAYNGKSDGRLDIYWVDVDARFSSLTRSAWNG